MPQVAASDGARMTLSADTLTRWKEQAQPWNTPGLTNEDIESVAFQIAGAIACRPCGATACSQEHPAQPSQWCRSCLLAVLVDSYVAEVEALRAENARLKETSHDVQNGRCVRCRTLEEICHILTCFEPKAKEIP